MLEGARYEISISNSNFPQLLKEISNPPNKLYVIGNLSALVPGIAIVGARSATPYGNSLAFHYGKLAAQHGVTVISGGALGCDSQSHRGALDIGGKTVVFLGGGCDNVYPARNHTLFQQVIDAGGAVVSENPWAYEPLKYTFLARNRLIAGLSLVTLVVEAGKPSGTFSTANCALDSSREVWAVPGSIVSPKCAGCNQLIYDGAVAIINDEVFSDNLMSVFSTNFIDNQKNSESNLKMLLKTNPILNAAITHPQSIDELLAIAREYDTVNPHKYLNIKLVEAESSGLICKYKNGKYGPQINR